MKRMMVAVVALLMLAAPAGAVTLQLKIPASAGTDLERTSAYFAAQVEQLTGGKVAVAPTVETGLVDFAADIDDLRASVLDLAVVPSSALAATFAPIGLLSLPYLFVNDEQFWWYVTGARGKALTQPLLDTGLRLLGYVDLDAAGFAARLGPLATVDDFVRTKLRVGLAPLAAETVEALGGSPVRLPFGEIYVALQTGVIDGAEVTPATMVDGQFDEVARGFTHDQHIRLPYLLLASQPRFAALPRAQRQAIRRAAELAEAYGRGSHEGAEERLLAELDDLDVDVVVPERAPFIAAVDDLVTSKALTIGVLDEVDYIRENAGAF
jgi:TRAP-type C4-dicarboxylate transport system substrate-binding protein